MAANLNKHHLWKLTRVRSVQQRDTLGHWVVVVGVRACWGKADLCLAVHDRRSPCPPTTSILLGSFSREIHWVIGLLWLVFEPVGEKPICVWQFTTGGAHVLRRRVSYLDGERPQAAALQRRRCCQKIFAVLCWRVVCVEPPRVVSLLSDYCVQSCRSRRHTGRLVNEGFAWSVANVVLSLGL